MANTDENKVVSYRIDNETREKVERIADELGVNKGAALSRMIEAFELQRGKDSVPEAMQGDIEQVQQYTAAILRHYTNTVTALATVKETVRVDFEDALARKDALIYEKQQQLAEAKQSAIEAVAAQKQAEKAHAELANQHDKMCGEMKKEIANLQSQLADKEKLNGVLTETCDNQRAQVAAACTEAQTATNALKALQAQQSDLQAQVARMQAQVADLSAQAERRELQQQKTILDIETKHNENIQAYIEKMQLIEAKKIAEINEYQEKYKKLLNEIDTKNHAKSAKKKGESEAASNDNSEEQQISL